MRRLIPYEYTQVKVIALFKSFIYLCLDCIYLFIIYLFMFRFYLFIYYLFILEKGEGREKGSKRNLNVWLPFMTWPAT